MGRSASLDAPRQQACRVGQQGESQRSLRGEDRGEASGRQRRDETDLDPLEVHAGGRGENPARRWGALEAHEGTLEV